MRVDIASKLVYKSSFQQYFLNQQYNRKRQTMSKWQDEFDLDDFDAKPAPKKQKDNNKSKNAEDDFFDLEGQPSNKSNKLPIINKKQPEPTPPPYKDNKKSKNVYDDYEEIYEEVQEVKSPPKKQQKQVVEESNYYEELEEIQEVRPKQAEKSSPKAGNKTAKNMQEEQFYQSLQQIKPPPRELKKLSPASAKKIPAAAANVYESRKKVEQPEEVQEDYDDYGQDFEEEVKETKMAPKKSQTSANLKTKEKHPKENSVEPKKYAVNTNQIFTNKEQKDLKTQPSVPKPQPKENKIQSSKGSKKIIQAKVGHSAGVSQPPKQIQKSYSRKSLKSNDSRVGNSRVSKKHTTQFTSNKHMLLVQKNFPEDDQKLSGMAIEKLSRVNENIREMIRKFNEELNELINKNMILLKDKPVQKERKVQQRIRVLEEQLKSGATALQVVENEYERLKGRQGELKEEQYLLIMQKKIEEVKQQTKQTSKLITKLKYEVNNEGNKLSRQDIQKKMAQELHQIKTMLIQLKKEEQRNEAKNEKLNKMIEELEGKNSDKEYELSQQIDTAKEKGIQINVKQALLRKYEELKLKVANSENHGRCLQSLHKSKCDVISHEKQQIKISIKNVESQIKNLIHTIEHAQEQSIKTIKKAQQNPKLSQEMIESLDKLLKSIEQNQNGSYFQIRTEGNNSQASQRPLKKSMYENLHKEKQSRNSASKGEQPTSKPEPHSDEINLLKPNFMKKKDKPNKTEEEQANNLYEKMWHEEEQEQKRQDEKKKEEERKLEEEKKRLAQQESKKKPFMLKKNRLNNGEQKSFEQTPEIKKAEETLSLKLESPQAPAEPLEQDEKPAIKPKFTRFNKRATERQNDLSVEHPQSEVKQPQKPIEEPPKEEIKPKQDQEAPIIMPKRFNLRNKLQKKEDSYIPSIEKVEQKKVEQKQSSASIASKPTVISKQESYRPVQPEAKNIENEAKAEEAQEKPRLMLRLRDRQKKEAADNTDYVPTRMTEVEDRSQRDKVGNYSPSTKQNRKEDAYVPTFKRAEKDYNNNSSVSKENIIAPKQNIYESLTKEPVNNPYAPKQIGSYPSAPPVQEEKVPVNNPYAQRQDAPKKEREGPVKKIKIQNKAPKQKFNIYQQAEDLTEPLSQPPAVVVPSEPVSQKPQYNAALAKTDELDLNAMLGIKKKEKGSELDDLLGEVKIDKKKQKKKNTDFFNDLDL